VAFIELKFISWGFIKMLKSFEQKKGLVTKKPGSGFENNNFVKIKSRRDESMVEKPVNEFKPRRGDIIVNISYFNHQ
jgi:hypothetical protein